jgi:hypothetical protein
MLSGMFQNSAIPWVISVNVRTTRVAARSGASRSLFTACPTPHIAPEAVRHRSGELVQQARHKRLFRIGVPRLTGERHGHRPEKRARESVQSRPRALSRDWRNRARPNASARTFSNPKHVTAVEIVLIDRAPYAAEWPRKDIGSQRGVTHVDSRSGRRSESRCFATAQIFRDVPLQAGRCPIRRIFPNHVRHAFFRSSCAPFIRLAPNANCQLPRVASQLQSSRLVPIEPRP